LGGGTPAISPWGSLQTQLKTTKFKKKEKTDEIAQLWRGRAKGKGVMFMAPKGKNRIRKNATLRVDVEGVPAWKSG